MKCVEELRALIQSERNWIMPPGKSSPRRSAQVLQWLTHSLSLLCWFEETVCWSCRGRRLRAKFLSRARFLPCSITRGIANGSLSHETFDAVAAWLGDQCLDSLVRHDADSTLTYLLTSRCATYVGITGQRDGGKGLGGGSTRLMEHIRGIRGDARHNARHRAGECRDKKRAFGQSDDSHLTMLRLYRGPSASAAALERVLTRTLRPSGNRVGFGPPTVPKIATAARGKTPPWRRVPAPLLVRHLDPIASIVSRLPTILHRAELDAVRDLRKRELVTAVAAGSKVVYRRNLVELLLTGTMGPVPLSKGLAVALMSDPHGPPDPESLFRGERDVYAGIRLAKNIVRPVIRARTLRRLHGVLKTWNLPPHRRRVVKIPAEIPRSQGRKFFLDNLSDLRCTRPACFAWVWEQTIFTSTRKCTFSSVSWGAIAACKQADTDRLLHPPLCSADDVGGADSVHSREVSKPNAGSGTLSGAGKDRRYWKFECVRSKDKLEEALRCLVCDWRTTVPGVHLPLRQREVKKFMCSLPPCDIGEEYYAYTLGMDQPPSAGRIWAPDDKARTIAWDVSEQDYLLAGLKQMARDTTHWKMVPDSPESVAKLYEGLHSLVGRKERVHLSRKKGWTGSIVPYTYCTIKSKCHDQSAMRRGRTCLKPGHSCMRKIISWWHHPARPQLRAAGRAAAAWIECLRMSWECVSMKNSCSDLRRLWCRACRMAGDGCCRSHCRLCGKVLHSPTVYTADAAQFYEEVRGRTSWRHFSTYKSTLNNEGSTPLCCVNRDDDVPI